MNTVNSAAIGGVLNTLHRLLGDNSKSPHLLAHIYSSLQFVVQASLHWLIHVISLFFFTNPYSQVFKKALFTYSGNSKFCELLSFEILAHCNSSDPLIRSKAASMFYLFLKVPGSFMTLPYGACLYLIILLKRKIGSPRAISRECKSNQRLQFLD